LLGGTVAAGMATEAGISDAFVREIERLMQPGTSALFILDDAVDMKFILHAIQGLGGTVLKTNVNPERAKLIQSTLASTFSEQKPITQHVTSTVSNRPAGPFRVEEDALVTPSPLTPDHDT
jgi:uncharacterized membrane protein